MTYVMAIGVFEKTAIAQKISSLVLTANVFLAPLFAILMTTAAINRMK
jgi:hypothetical protein